MKSVLDSFLNSWQEKNRPAFIARGWEVYNALMDDGCGGLVYTHDKHVICCVLKSCCGTTPCMKPQRANQLWLRAIFKSHVQAELQQCASFLLPSFVFVSLFSPPPCLSLHPLPSSCRLPSWLQSEPGWHHHRAAALCCDVEVETWKVSSWHLPLMLVWLHYSYYGYTAGCHVRCYGCPEGALVEDSSVW